MIGKATTRYVRISARKVRQVMDLVRGQQCARAMARLAHFDKRAARYVKRLLHSALSGVENRLGYGPEQLFISKITADKGPHLKRFRPRAMGRGVGILKRTSHLHVEVDLLPGAGAPSGGSAQAGKQKPAARGAKRAKAAAAKS